MADFTSKYAFAFESSDDDDDDDFKTQILAPST
jgi:hypothetical protein